MTIKQFSLFREKKQRVSFLIIDNKLGIPVKAYSNVLKVYRFFNLPGYRSFLTGHTPDDIKMTLGSYDTLLRRIKQSGNCKVLLQKDGQKGVHYTVMKMNVE